MPYTPTPEYTSVEKILSGANVEGQAVRGVINLSGLDYDRDARTQLGAALDELSGLNDELASGELTGTDRTDAEARKKVLEDAIVGVVEEVEALSPEQQNEAVHTRHVPSGREDFGPAMKADIDLAEAKKLKELIDAGTPDEFRASKPDEDEDDTPDQEIVRTATQCFLLYNIDYFADQHRKMLSNL